MAKIKNYLTASFFLLLSSLLLTACTQDMANIEYREGVNRGGSAKTDTYLSGNNNFAIAGNDNIAESKLEPLEKEHVSEEHHATAQTADKVHITSEGEDFFAWPINGMVIDKFGELVDGRKNDGINIIAPKGSDVHPARGGKVVYVGNDLAGYGNLVIIKHDGGWLSAYGHLDKITVQKGQPILENGVIGSVGEATDKNGDKVAQLHFALRKTGKKPEDPLKYLPRKVEY